MFSQSLWAIAMCARSSDPCKLSCAALVSHDCHGTLLPHLFKLDKFEPDQCAASFPSDWCLRKYTIHQAGRNAISLSRALSDKKTHCSCDKGNKKGISHFIKILSSWNPDLFKVDTQALGIDGSGGTDVECAATIHSSMNKLKLVDDDATHLLSGDTTDNGGGGVFDNLAQALQQMSNLCIHIEDHLVGNCTVHSLQLQLANAIGSTFGKGGWYKMNEMQHLHSV